MEGLCRTVGRGAHPATTRELEGHAISRTRGTDRERPVHPSPSGTDGTTAAARRWWPPPAPQRPGLGQVVFPGNNRYQRDANDLAYRAAHGGSASRVTQQGMPYRNRWGRVGGRGGGDDDDLRQRRSRCCHIPIFCSRATDSVFRVSGTDPSIASSRDVSARAHRLRAHRLRAHHLEPIASGLSIARVTPSHTGTRPSPSR